MKIDYLLKDKVLRFLCDHYPAEQNRQIDLKELLKVSGVDFDSVNAVLSYFARVGLISDVNSRRVALFLTLRVEAFDMLSHGGYTAQEELLKNNIEKLLLEIESLKPSMPEKVNTLTTIAANIVAAFGMFLTR